VTHPSTPGAQPLPVLDTPSRIDALSAALEPARNQLVGHPVYRGITTESDLHTFMEHHVFAVWDFMSLLTALQRQLSCVEVPWVPVGDPHLRRLINDIVLAEESDENGAGGYSSHFELYVAAMEQCGADIGPVSAFIDELGRGTPVRQALESCGAPPAAAEFCRSTMAIIETEAVAAVAGAFTFGREDLVPDMFREIVEDLRAGSLARYDTFVYYLDRHIEVDSDEHGPMAFRMVDELCGEDQSRWGQAAGAARASLESRVRLWDGTLAEIERRRTHSTAASSAP